MTNEAEKNEKPDIPFCYKCKRVFSTVSEVERHERDEPECSKDSANPHDDRK